mgnify:CR=1 FL=1
MAESFSEQTARAAFVAKFKRDQRCALNCYYYQALAADLTQVVLSS